MMKIYLSILAVMFLTICADLVFAQQTPNETETQTITRNGTLASSKGNTDMFTGSVRIEPLFQPTESDPTFGATVTFEPGARTAWHIHGAGQRLIVISGVGLTQAWGGPVVEIRPGDVVWCPPGVKHWHGASPTTAMAHIALTPTGGEPVQWLERVTDDQYKASER
jgi:quercetin dioxygenase-like cupin family protein